MKLRWLVSIGLLVAISGAMYFLYDGEPTLEPPNRQISTSPPETTGRQTSEPIIGAPPSTASSVVVAGTTGREADKKIWEATLKRARAEPVTASIHRAAVTGDIVDIATARWMRGVYCKDANVSTEDLRRKDVPITPLLTDYLSRLKEQCSRGGMRSPAGIPVKLDRGFGVDAQNFIEAASGAIVPNAQDRKNILKAVAETGSVQLLEVASSLITANDLSDLGLAPIAGIPPLIDHALVDLAIKIAACNARGDCDQVAFRNLECSAFNACVNDLRNFPRERIYGSQENRAALVKNLNVKPAQLESRWHTITKFVATMYSVS